MKNTFIFISLFFTFILILAISSLFFIPNWHTVIENLMSDEMLFSLKLSIMTGIISTMLVIIVSIPIGYSLSRFSFPFKGVVKTIIDLPIAFPELVLGLCLLLLFGNTIFGKLLKDIGLNFVFTKEGIIAAQFFTALPYAIRIIKSTFDYIDPRLEFVSMSLGYSMPETFLKVSLPLAKSGLFACTVISLARCIGTFGSVLILAGGTSMKTEILPITLYLNISYGNIGMAITSGMLLIVISFIAIFIFERMESNV